MPIVEGFQIFDEARRRVSGLAGRARMCMSHATGKVEIFGVNEDLIFLRYHRAKNPADSGRLLLMERDDEAYWLDQLRPARLQRDVGALEAEFGPEQELRLAVDR